MKAIYKIYQPNQPTFRVEKGRDVYFLEDFHEVYEGEYDRKSNQKDIETLEWLFEKFNMARPSDFKGHSLSVGDIVELKLIDEDDLDYDFETNKLEPRIYEWSQYICCNFGWNKIDLIPEQTYIDAADAKLYRQMNG